MPVNQNGNHSNRLAGDGRQGWQANDQFEHRDRNVEHDRYRQEQEDRDRGQGQSGYTAGRHGADPSLRFDRGNVGASYREYEDRQPIGGDERWSGRGGERLDHRERGASSHHGKGPKSFTMSDERLRERVCEALTDDHDVDASDIDVTVKDGEVTLTGIVEDRRAKRLAEDCADSVRGVRDVQNQLRIRAAAPPSAEGIKAPRGGASS
jgi:osmotically-inducible protein OsmY